MLQRGAVAVVALLVLAQLVPYGRSHSNPPTTAEPSWDSPATRALAVRACFDCHSNEVRWPWYSSIAPASWLVQHDVDEGRGVLNFSEWNRSYEEAREAAESVVEGEMPLKTYLVLHPAARLTARERSMLSSGLARTLGGAGAKRGVEAD